MWTVNPAGAPNKLLFTRYNPSSELHLYALMGTYRPCLPSMRATWLFVDTEARCAHSPGDAFNCVVRLAGSYFGVQRSGGSVSSQQESMSAWSATADSDGRSYGSTSFDEEEEDMRFLQDNIATYPSPCVPTSILADQTAMSDASGMSVWHAGVICKVEYYAFYLNRTRGVWCSHSVECSPCMLLCFPPNLPQVHKLCSDRWINPVWAI